MKEESLKNVFIEVMMKMIEDFTKIRLLLLENVNEVINDDSIKKLEYIAEKITMYQAKIRTEYIDKIIKIKIIRFNDDMFKV